MSDWRERTRAVGIVRDASDFARAQSVIRAARLQGPNDAVGEFRIPPRGSQARIDVADFVFDMADQFAARAVLDAPNGIVVTFRPHFSNTQPQP